MPAMIVMPNRFPRLSRWLRRRIAPALLALLAGGWIGAAAADPASRPIVVELFTSQGCSSCPPADAFLAELAQRPELLALSFHVDYWNYIGWDDPFSSAEATQRQRDYGRALGSHVVYTPQMVIDGQWDVIGSKRAAVEKAIAAAAAAPHLTLAFSGDSASGYRLVLPATALAAPAHVWLVLYDRLHRTEIETGENAGETIENRNVVRAIVDLGPWDGAAREIPIALDPARTAGRDSCAVIVQQDGPGAVLGAAVMALAK